jgi:lysozyme family protein
MSFFDKVIPILLDIEGGYVDNPHDPGGATKYGISLRYCNESNDALEVTRLLGIQHLGPITKEDIKNITADQASRVYKVLWWDKYHFEEFQNQEIATKAFCSAVNIGLYHAAICLQRAVRATCGKVLIEDGILGPESLKYINEYSSTTLLASYKSELAGYYRLLHNPSELNGWLNRAYA